MNKHLSFKLEGSNVVLVGAYKGVGLVLAKLLLACGANIILVGKTNKSKMNAKTVLKKYPSFNKVNFITLNLYKNENHFKLQKKIKTIFPSGINHMVSFLGTGKTKFGTGIPTSNWREMFDKNLFSVINLINNLLPLIKSSNDNKSITITAAIAGVERVSAPASYSVAKASLISYSSHLSNELAKDKIRVNCISPGNIIFKGGRWEEIIKEKGLKNIKRNILSNVAFNRLGFAEELAWNYLTVMSPRNSFMTGANIIVDGQQVKKTI